MADEPADKEGSAVPPGGMAEAPGDIGKPAGSAPQPEAIAAPSKPAAVPVAAAPPKAPAPALPKEIPLQPVPLENDLTRSMKERFGEAFLESWLDRKQAIVVVAREDLENVARYLRDEEAFEMLSDLTAVDWPKRERRFEIVLNLYSFAKNERLRVKANAADNEHVPTMTDVWPAANWLEREVYDMFGIVFDGHPDMRRILLPEEWEGFPLRKDYDILKQDQAWVQENLGIESGQ
jgi:NADH-quinone oxidoreductase subunit C